MYPENVLLLLKISYTVSSPKRIKKIKIKQKYSVFFHSAAFQSWLHG